jgi:hypothetical protein
MRNYGQQYQLNGGRPPYANPQQIDKFTFQEVDFLLTSGQRVCGAFILSVSPEKDPANATYGDFSYIIAHGGSLLTLQSNTAFIVQIGPKGSICR